MGILFIAFLALALLVVGSAWKQLRSNWRSIQSMRSDNKGATDAGLDIDIECSDGSNHHGHSHDGVHHGADASGHDFGGGHGGFDGGGGHH
jgi:hypothetical protein